MVIFSRVRWPEGARGTLTSIRGIAMRAEVWGLVLAACVEEPGAALLEDAPPPAPIYVTVADLPRGAHAVFDVWGAPPGASGRIVTGTHPGRTCPPALGACLDLGNLQTLGSFTANAYGSAQLVVFAPNTIRTPSVWFQAVTGGAQVARSAAWEEAVSPGAPYEIGHVDPMPGVAQLAAGQLIGERVVISDPGTLERFGMILSSSGGFGQLALYTDAGGVPGALAGYSVPFWVSGGAQEEPPQTPAALTPGAYWLMASFEQDTDVFAAPVGGRVVASAPHTLLSGLPDPFPTAQTDVGGGFNFYVVVR